LNRFYIERSLPYPLPSLATLLYLYWLHSFAFAGASLGLRAPYNNTIFGYRSVPTTRCYVGTALWVILGFLCFTCPPCYRVATGLAPGACRDIASFVPIPPNIDIVVRFLLPIW
jgi:hypothetical protein